MMNQLKSWLQEKKWIGSVWVRVFLFFLLGIVLYFLLWNHMIPRPLQVEKFEPSPSEIRSPVTVEDEEKTRELQQAAITAVQPVYQKKDSITENQMRRLNLFFDRVEQIRIEQGVTNSEKLEQLKQIMSGFSLAEQSYETLLFVDDKVLKEIRNVTTALVERIMEQGVQNYGASGQSQTMINDELSSLELSRQAKQLIEELTQSAVVPNIVYDAEATRELQALERSKVQPVMIQQNDVIVKQGQIIDDEVYRKLELAGLLKEKQSFWPRISLLLFIIFSMAFLYVFIRQSYPILLQDNRKLFMYVLLILLTVAILKVVSLGQHLGYQNAGFLAPVALGTMLIVLLLSNQLVVISALIFSMASGILFNPDQYGIPIDIQYALYAFAASVAGAYSLGRTRQRRYIVRAGLVSAATNVVMITALYMLTHATFPWREMGVSYAFGVSGGLLSAVLTIGFMPFFEGAFGILSTMKLIELSNPNHPLLRRLLTEAPGTYHHSIIVGNLAEAACEAIGADGLLARVGSYYHDVGKLNRPLYFIENQMNRENPHDRISPQLSKSIILAHPYDGVKLLKQYRIPKPICDIAEQHHGTSLLKYFYHKAKQESDEPVSETDYRYPGPKVQFKEVAVVEICDSVEAATRSMSHLTPEKLEKLVRNIVGDKLEDGQFDECDITLKELEIVTNTVCETLLGTFHSRIEYPDDKAQNQDTINEVKSS